MNKTEKTSMPGKEILVVGGAGYIGSHMALMLQEAGYEAVILDNLSAGHRDAALTSQLIIGDIANAKLLDLVFSQHSFAAVMHFASCIEVGESVVNPLKYYQNNVAATVTLLQAMRKHAVNHFVFSSSAAVYGEPQSARITESHPLAPINPYGRSKLMVEEVIKDMAKAHGFRFAVLRYFNAAGADPLGRLSERHQPETHLLPLLLQTAAEMRPAITLFGRDYPTVDGSCVRDYIHVSDLCRAHLLALEALNQQDNNLVYNLGTGQGYSVLQIIEAARKVTGCPISVLEGERRSGDPAVLVADASAAQRELGWQPAYPDIETIIQHVWRTQQVLLPA
jgi:UDP-glucose 4-epimerase